MSHRLRMSAEIGDWLTELRTEDVIAATEVGAALVALMEAPDPPGPALITDPAMNRAPSLAQQAAALDSAQQSLQWALRLARTVATDAATDVRRALHDVRELERESDHDRGELAARRRRLAGARLFEQKATEHSQRSQREVDAFRARAEAGKARYQAALAARDLHAGVAADQAEAGYAGATSEEERAAAAEGIARAAHYHLQVLLAEAPRLVRRISDGTTTTALTADEPGQTADTTSADSAEPDSPSLAAGLLEMRADPLGGDIRLLFAMEPPDTAMVLAVLEGEGAVRVHRDKALGLASELLTEIRSGEWPPALAASAAETELTFDNPAAFLDRFYAGSADVIRHRAAARANATTLAELRRRSGVSLADLAEATGITEERLWFIEDGGLRVAQVREAVACIRALGGHLDLTADLAGETQPLF
jgi:hypothetical protein